MRSRLDDVVSSAGNSLEMQANCPFCISRIGVADYKQHLYVSKVKRVAHCFKCEWAGSWESLIMSVDGCSYSEAIKHIIGFTTAGDFDGLSDTFQAGIEFEEALHEIEGIVPPNYQTLIRCDNIEHTMAIQHLQGRGISEDLIFSGMFGIVPGDMRVYIWASSNYWQARTLLKGQKPKYKNPPELKVGDTLGLWDSIHLGDYVKSLPGPVYVAEGVFSALALLSRSKASLALLGKSLHSQQLRRLQSFQRPLVIILDKDAERNSFEIAERLHKAGKEDVMVAVLEFGDPEDCQDFKLYHADWKSRIQYELGVAHGIDA
jgi:DNA primase